MSRCLAFLIVLVVVAALLLFIGQLVNPPSTTAAHGGGLDKYDCHRDNKAGNYHCHRGPVCGKEVRLAGGDAQGFLPD
jgi:hypothetical protein